MFFCEFCKISKNTCLTYFVEQLQTAASGDSMRVITLQLSRRPQPTWIWWSFWPPRLYFLKFPVKKTFLVKLSYHIYQIIASKLFQCNPVFPIQVSVFNVYFSKDSVFGSRKCLFISLTIINNCTFFIQEISVRT